MGSTITGHFADMYVQMTDITLRSLTYRALCYKLSVLYRKRSFRRARLSAYGMIHDRPSA